MVLPGEEEAARTSWLIKAASELSTFLSGMPLGLAGLVST
jgi:hypothetical protein